MRVVSGEGAGVFGPLTVDLKGEAWAARLEVEDNGDRIAGLAVRTHRLRVAAEGARAFTLAGGGARGYHLGARFGFGPDFELGLEGERRESRTERAGHGLMLRGRMRW